MTINWDPENEKLYFKLHVGYSYDIEDVKGLSFNTGLAMFVGNGHYVTGKGVLDWDDGFPVGVADRSAITTVIWDVSLNYALNDYISFGPFASLNFAVDHNVREDWKHDDNSKSGCNTLWGFGGKIKF